MKLSLAVALNLALLATAAPAALYSKRADGQEVSPEAELAQKIAYGSLKSAAEMLNINNKDTNAEDADLGNNMPVTMTPNDKASFPGADGSEPKKPKKPTQKRPNKPTPVRDGDEGEVEEEDAKVSKAPPSPTPSAKPKASSSAASTPEEEDAKEEETGLKKPAAEEAEAEKPAPKPKDDNPLSKVPLIGGLLGGASPLGGL